MLARVLLHVIAAPLCGNHALYFYTRVRRPVRIEKMENRSVVFLGDFDDLVSLIAVAGFQPAGIENLPATRGVKGCLIEDDGGTGFCARRWNDFCNLAVEFEQVRRGVVEPASHL